MYSRASQTLSCLGWGDGHVIIRGVTEVGPRESGVVSYRDTLGRIILRSMHNLHVQLSPGFNDSSQSDYYEVIDLRCFLFGDENTMIRAVNRCNELLRVDTLGNIVKNEGFYQEYEGSCYADYERASSLFYNREYPKANALFRTIRERGTPNYPLIEEFLSFQDTVTWRVENVKKRGKFKLSFNCYSPSYNHVLFYVKEYLNGPINVEYSGPNFNPPIYHLGKNTVKPMAPNKYSVKLTYYKRSLPKRYRGAEGAKKQDRWLSFRSENGKYHTNIVRDMAFTYLNSEK